MFVRNDDPQGRDYIGLTEGTFKKRFTQHKSSFNNIDYSNKTSLSKYVWSLKNEVLVGQALTQQRLTTTDPTNAGYASVKS